MTDIIEGDLIIDITILMKNVVYSYLYTDLAEYSKAGGRWMECTEVYSSSGEQQRERVVWNQQTPHTLVIPT